MVRRLGHESQNVPKLAGLPMVFAFNIWATTNSVERIGLEIIHLKGLGLNC